MRVRQLNISNFRSVEHGSVDFHGHTLLVGGNNVGKSTISDTKPAKNILIGIKLEHQEKNVGVLIVRRSKGFRIDESLGRC